ncbi:MAG: ATP-binding protein [Bacilli bacterium]|nr:ATP-binding protein [Bacilli bacterium]
MVGIRRCGKSVILKQIIEEIKAEGVKDNHILFINFEFIEYEELKDYKKLNTYVKNKIKDDKLYYLFFDEIQNVDKFELVINSLRSSLDNVSIFITGSNSRLLSQELATDLSGRYVSFKINPLNYKEFIELTNQDAKDFSVFWNYVEWGGLPNRVKFNAEDDLKLYLQSVFDSIILRDVINRLKLNDTNLFVLILRYLVDTIGREFSAKNIVSFLKSEGRNVSTETIYIYLDALCKAFIVKKINRYDIHGRLILKTLNKYYLTDLGLVKIMNTSEVFNKSYALENVVYNELLVRGYEVYVGKTKSGEIDFVANKYDKKIYIQVAVTALGDEKTREREFGAFEVIQDNYTKYVLTMDNVTEDYKGIKHINIIDFLLNDEF